MHAVARPQTVANPNLSRASRADVASALALALLASCAPATSQEAEGDATSPPPPDAETISRPSADREPAALGDGTDGAGQQPGSSGGSGGSGGSDDGAGGSSGGSGGSATPGDGNDGGSDDGAEPAEQAPLLSASSSAADSLLYVMVWRDPSALGNSFAHDHVVRATAWAGSLQFRSGDPTACFVDIDVETAELLPDEPAMRSEVGLPGVLSEGDRTQVRSSMLGVGQLEASTFPTISFTSVACSGDLDGAGTLAVDGDLTIRNTTRRVTWTVEYEVDAAGRMFARGDLTIAQTDFGITPYQAFFGTVKVADDVDLSFDLVGLPLGS